MKRNKMFFRRIAAFITAFNFLVSVNYSMIVYADELDELFPEETDTPISTEETSKDTLMKSEYVRVTVNGTDVPKISDVFDSFFFSVTVGETEDNITEVMIPENMELSDMLWDMGDFEGPDYILADIDSRTYRIDGIEKSGYITDICLTEYYELNFPEGLGYSIVPADGNISENNKYPHDSLMKVCADDGWIADEYCTFKLKGINDIRMTDAGRDYMLVINNGNEDVKIPFKKSAYYLYCPVSDKIRCVINGQESNNVKCTWLDDNKINAEFYVEDDADIKITKVYLVNNITGEKISVDQDTDGKSAFVKELDTELLSSQYNNEAMYSFEFETVLDYVKINSFCNDSYIEQIECKTKIIDGKIFVDVPTILYKNGKSEYILNSYTENNSKDKIDVNVNDLFESNKFSEFISIEYLNKDLNIYYDLIIQDKDECITTPDYPGNGSYYAIRNSRFINLLDINNEKRCVIIYKETIDKEEIWKYNQENNFVFTPIENNRSAIFIKSILYLENGEFHNILESPLYFYIDDYAPKISLTNPNSNEYDNTQWSKDTYEFEISANDHESFPQIDGAETDVNEVYSVIDQAASGISKIQVGDYSFEKTDGTWAGTAAEGTAPEYEVKISEKSEEKFLVLVSLKNESELKGFEKELLVSVTDKCDNKSEELTANVKIDTEKPTVKYIKINGDQYTFNSNNYLAVNSDKFDVKLKTSDAYSGIGTIEVEYAGNTEKYSADQLNTETDGNEEVFVIPVTSSKDTAETLKITVTDNAGNSISYYYGTYSLVEDVEKASLIVADTTPPVCSLIVSQGPDYTDSKGRRWYSRLPEYVIDASDKIEEINSGIFEIVVRVNGAERGSDFIFMDETKDYSVLMEHDEENPDLVRAYISYQGRKFPVSEFYLSDTQGRVETEVYAVDNAGNAGEICSETIYADVSCPISSDTFEVENEDDELRKYGSFFNRDVKIKVDVYEASGAPASGLKEAVLYIDDKEYTYDFSSENSSAAEFIIPFESEKMSSFTGNPFITVTDNVGNKSVIKFLKSEKGSDYVVFENEKPEIVIPDTALICDYIDENNNKWFNGDIQLSVSVDEQSSGKIFSGIRDTVVSINSKIVESEDFRENDEITGKVRYDINTSSADNGDGKYEISVETSDNSGNHNKVSDTVWIDRTAPEITDISVDGVGSVFAGISQGLIPLAYGYFIAPEKELVVKAEDRAASSGIKYIAVDLYNFDGTLDKHYEIDRSELEYSDGIYTGKIKLPELFKGVISTYAVDNVEYQSDKKSPDGFIIENKSKHEQEKNPVISLPETQYTDNNGLPLYSSEISIPITATDSYSGIKSVRWNISEYGDSVWKEIRIDSNGKISGDNDEDFVVSKNDLNLVTEIKGNIKSLADRGNNRIKIITTDNSGHVSESEQVFSIDKTAPEITVLFDESVPDKEHRNVYKTSRSAKIFVKERSFDSSLINISFEGSQASVGEWKLVEGTKGTDSAVYQTTVFFEDDGEYSFTVNGKDICQNAAQGYTSEKFIIDKTAPELEIITDGKEAVNGRYYNSNRSITIKITEQNFSPDRITVSGTLDEESEGFPEIKGWKTDGNVHTAVLNFEKDGEYTLRISGKDKAGNQFSSYSEKFCIDTKAPDISFKGVSDKSANSGDISFSAVVTDINIAGEVSVKVNGAKRGDISETAGLIEKTENGYVFRLNEIPVQKEYDDIYTITVIAGDQAENTSEKEISFSVNRFGSNYVFDENTLRIANTYIKEPEDIVVHEINTDRLTDGRTVIKIIRDSEIIILEEGKDYSVSVSGGNGEWYDYEYVINAENFNDDAAYMVTISSEDEAGNRNDSVSNDKKSELRFGVDKTSPRCNPLNIESNGSYKASALEVKFSVSDNILIDEVTVELNGIDISDEIKLEGSICSFIINSSEKTQNVKVTVTDQAGNQTESVVENILVSENLFRVMTHKTWFKLLCGTAILGGAAGTGVYIRRKRS